MAASPGQARARLKVVGTVSKAVFPTIGQFALASPREGSISTGDESVAVNVTPRNVSEVCDTANLIDPMRARPMPASVTALLP